MGSAIADSTHWHRRITIYSWRSAAANSPLVVSVTLTYGRFSIQLKQPKPTSLKSDAGARRLPANLRYCELTDFCANSPVLIVISLLPRADELSPRYRDRHHRPPPLYDEPYRPQYHFSPPMHFMNDPNGQVYFNGTFHLYYQYNPLQLVAGHQSWGHAESTDLIHWKNADPQIAIPEATTGPLQGQIFTGSAVVDSNNTSIGPKRSRGALPRDRRRTPQNRLFGFCNRNLLITGGPVSIFVRRATPVARERAPNRLYTRTTRLHRPARG